MNRTNKLGHLGVLIVLATGTLCCPKAVTAQVSGIDPELHIVEPIITEETMPNEPRDWDVRFSGSYSWQGAEGSGFLPRAQLFFGIANRWGGEIEVPLALASQGTNHFGFGDISATVKYLVRKPAVRLPGFVLGLEMTFPNGNASKGLGEGVLDATPFVATVYASRRAVLQGNVGYSVVHKVQARDAYNQVVYNGAVAFPFERLKTWAVWEISGTHGKAGNRATFSAGLKHNLTPECFLAIALPVGLTSQTPRVGIVLQMQINLRSTEGAGPE
jgi:hypothetical protein